MGRKDQYIVRETGGIVTADPDEDLPPLHSIATAADDEAVVRETQVGSVESFPDIGPGISIKRAETEFAELQRELTQLSQSVSPTSRRHSRYSYHGRYSFHAPTSRHDRDAEKGPDQNAPFNLEATLRGDLDAEREAGILPKYIGVCWDGLTVKGIGGGTTYVKTVPDVLMDWLDVVTPVMQLLGIGRRKASEVTILDGFRGLCKPGEMVLVVGKPGSGCTSFLKTIANQRAEYTYVGGDVRYGPFSAPEFKKYRGEAVYNQEDDMHHANLTVEQTLAFAVDTKIPHTRPGGLSRSKFRKKIVNLLLKMFNIEKTRRTMMGDDQIRGVSGGERRRVSIAEMMITDACVLSWDKSTRGLDASTALDFVKSLRVQTNLYRTSTFVSLNQASESAYSHFDKVLVIDSGKQVFFGPAQEARAYFEGLGFAPRLREPTFDYLIGCTDEFEREYAPGKCAANAPHDSKSLEAAFRKSTFASALEDEMSGYTRSMKADTAVHEGFRAAIQQSKRWGAKRSAYSTGFHLQIWALVKRQFVAKLQNRLALALLWLKSMVVAFLLGTLYWDLDRTSASAFSKGGLLFVSVIFNALQTMSDLVETVQGRPILNKHKAYTFHRPSALWIAQLIVDQAFYAAQIFVFSLMVYFMSHLVREVSAFFTFFLMIFTCNTAAALFFRTIGCVSPTFSHAINITVFTMGLFILTSGYLVQYQNQHLWQRWVFWINPIGLSVSSLMINEFSRINMTCTHDSLIPSGEEYGDIHHQVCTLPGSEGGTLQVSGEAYLEHNFSYRGDDLWRNWAILVGLIVSLLLLNIVLGEVMKYGTGKRSVGVFRKPNRELDALNGALRRRKEQRRVQGGKFASGGEGCKVGSESVLTWEALKYDVPTPAGPKTLLNALYGFVKPGQLTALMGASGSGKTCLLDVLAARAKVGVVTGRILLDGVKPGKQFQRGTGYAQEVDVHEPAQTVREALRFSASLRQPFKTPQEEKYAHVEEIISLLEMENIADAMIGFPGCGLTIEERKRVSIGVELAAKPDVLLFLDEPTSGFDSQSAFNVVRFLKKLAAAGQAILCTIHQPNPVLFENFDRLVLLQAGGRCVYFGEIGRDAHVLRDYLKRYGAAAGETDNVTEFMLQAIGAGITPRIGPRDWADIWEDSPEFEMTKREIERLKQQRMAAAGNEDVGVTVPGPETSNEKNNNTAGEEYATPIRHQLKMVMRRMSLAFWRSPDFLLTMLFNHVVISFLTGFTYMNLEDSRISLQYRIFVIFRLSVLPVLISNQVQVSIIILRTIVWSCD